MKKHHMERSSTQGVNSHTLPILLSKCPIWCAYTATPDMPEWSQITLSIGSWPSWGALQTWDMLAFTVFQQKDVHSRCLDPKGIAVLYVVGKAHGTSVWSGTVHGVQGSQLVEPSENSCSGIGPQKTVRWGWTMHQIHLTGVWTLWVLKNKISFLLKPKIHKLLTWVELTDHPNSDHWLPPSWTTEPADTSYSHENGSVLKLLYVDFGPLNESINAKMHTICNMK